MGVYICWKAYCNADDGGVLMEIIAAPEKNTEIYSSRAWRRFKRYSF